MEVVVIIEGIDASSSATIQMRQSFKASDILFNQEFVNCVEIDPDTGAAIIDFNRFHMTSPLDKSVISIA